MGRSAVKTEVWRRNVVQCIHLDVRVNHGTKGVSRTTDLRLCCNCSLDHRCHRIGKLSRLLVRDLTHFCHNVCNGWRLFYCKVINGNFLTGVSLTRISCRRSVLHRKTPLRKPNRGEKIFSIKPRPKCVYNFLGLLYCFIV